MCIFFKCKIEYLDSPFYLQGGQDFKRTFLSYSSNRCSTLGCVSNETAKREMRQWNSLGQTPIPQAGQGVGMVSCELEVMCIGQRETKIDIQEVLSNQDSGDDITP